MGTEKSGKKPLFSVPIGFLFRQFEWTLQRNDPVEYQCVFFGIFRIYTEESVSYELEAVVCFGIFQALLYIAVFQNVQAEVRLYENIIDEEKGVYNEDGSLNLNPNSLTEKEIFVESNFADAKAYESFQFVRQGYFCVDSHDSSKEHLVFNRIVSLKSSFKLPK